MPKVRLMQKYGTVKYVKAYTMVDKSVLIVNFVVSLEVV